MVIEIAEISAYDLSNEVGEDHKTCRVFDGSYM